MINNTEFSKRLHILMDYYQISASAFADRIQVPRSSISHLLSGRNKPSLDFVLKVVKEFDEVELYWLLNGKGNFPHDKTEKSKLKEDKLNPSITISKSVEHEPASSFHSTTHSKKNIERIVIFYTDGTFNEYLK